MQLVSRALLILGLFVLPHASRKAQPERWVQVGRARVKVALDASTWSGAPIGTAPALANMSLSPWTYRESSEASRLPMWIYNAQCLTSGCLSLNGEGEDASLEAKPIYYHTLVLHRVPRQRKAKKKKGKRIQADYKFQLSMEVVSVGCTCVRPTVMNQQ